MKISLVDRWSIVDRLVDDLRKHWYIFLVARYRNRAGRYGAQLFFLPRVLRYFSYFPTGDLAESGGILLESPHLGVREIFALPAPYLIYFFKFATAKWDYNLHTLFSQVSDKERGKTERRARLQNRSMMIYYGDLFIKIHVSKSRTTRTFLTKRIARFTIWIGS